MGHLRVAWFLPHFNKDLLPSPCFTLGKRLVEYGVKVSIITPKVFNEPIVEFLNGIEIYRSRDMYLPFKNFPYPVPIFFFKKAVEIISNAKVDILCWHTYHYLHAMYVPLVKRATKKPTTLTILSFPGICWIYPVRWTNFLAYSYSVSFGRQILNAVDKIIVDFPHNAVGVEHLHIPTEKVCVIPWGVDCDRFKPMPKMREGMRRRYQVADDEVVLGYAGRLVPVKGIDILILAASRLLKEGRKIKLLIIGGGFRSVGGPGNKYESMARNVLGNRVIITGWVKPQMVPLYWQMADIAVQPSYAESGGGGAMESSACGIPVVASRVGGLQDVVKNEHTGFLVRPRDVNELCDKLKLLIDNYWLRSKLGRNARRYMEENFDWSIITRKYIKLYHTLLEQQG